MNQDSKIPRFHQGIRERAIVGINLSELFIQLNERCLTFRRTAGGELEVIGDTGRLTDEIRAGIVAHRETILTCLPQRAEPTPLATANAIRAALDEFAEWLKPYHWWAHPERLADIDRRLAQVVDTQDLRAVEGLLEALRLEVQGIHWPLDILPLTLEVEAMHAIAAGADRPDPNAAPWEGGISLEDLNRGHAIDDMLSGKAG